MGKADVSRSLAREENNRPVELDLKETLYEGLDWTQLAEDGDQRQVLVDTVINPWVP
jgi:hypothetical protein